MVTASLAESTLTAGSEGIVGLEDFSVVTKTLLAFEPLLAGAEEGAVDVGWLDARRAGFGGSSTFDTIAKDGFCQTLVGCFVGSALEPWLGSLTVPAKTQSSVTNFLFRQAAP